MKVCKIECEILIIGRKRTRRTCPCSLHLLITDQMIIVSNHSFRCSNRMSGVITITNIKNSLFIIISKQNNRMTAKMAVNIHRQIRKIRHIHINEYRLIFIYHPFSCFKNFVIILALLTFYFDPKMIG